MNHYSFDISIQFPTDCPEAEFDSIFDLIADAADALTGMDADAGANTAARTIDLCMTFTGSDDQSDAIAKAISAARTALHTAGMHTPGWDQIIRQARLSVPADLSVDDDDCDTGRHLALST